jgi:hypothetical protein
MTRQILLFLLPWGAKSYWLATHESLSGSRLLGSLKEETVSSGTTEGMAENLVSSRPRSTS